MHHKIKRISKAATDSFVSLPMILRSFLRDESIGGKLIVGFAVLAIVIVNSPLREAYESFWHISFSIGLGDLSLSQDLRHWVNSGLMATFFLVVGLEIKRELVVGELKDIKKAILPVAAAFGGMIVPAIIYLGFNWNSDAIRGWGIPIATDIAFAVAVLSFLSKRVPLSLKLFLLSLAIVDDIGAIFVIALFYAEIINYGYLAASFALIIVMFLLRQWLSRRLALFILAGAVLWVTAHLSGIHASIVGAVVGLLAPLTAAPNGKSVSKQLEEFFLPISTFIALPIFALANAGVVLSLTAFHHPDTPAIMSGVIGGLILGKLIGISGVAWLMVRLGVARLPHGVGWLHIIGVSLIAGIGFTVSIFITELAFADDAQSAIAKISIFIASGMAAILGVLFLLKAKEIKHILDEV